MRYLHAAPLTPTVPRTVSTRVLALAVLLAFAAGLALPTVQSALAHDPPPSGVSLEEVAVVDRGCRDDVRDVARSGGGAGHYEFTATVDTDHPDARVRAAVTDTTQAGSDYHAYRVDVVTLPAPNGSEGRTCPGAVTVDVAVNATEGARGTRVATYVDGDPRACSGDCTAIMRPREWREAADATASRQVESPPVRQSRA